LNGLTTPDILHWTFSGKMVFFTVLGGFQTFFGPIVGAVIFNYLETYAVGHTVYWQMVLGIVLVALVLALPAGIVGPLRRVAPRRARSQHHAALHPPEDRAGHRGELPARQPVRPAQRAGQRGPRHLLAAGPDAPAAFPRPLCPRSPRR